MNRLVSVTQALKAKGIRMTSERHLILRRAVTHLHFAAEELVKDVRAIDPSVSRMTVFRTLGLLQRTGLVEKHDFHHGPPYYEVTYGKARHDHLMCTRCGEIIEFQEPRWARLQDAVVKRYGYRLLSHTHKLYGLCGRCQTKDGDLMHKQLELHVEEIVA
jgi:Fur family ferric uptake transcriptional regulator